MRKAPFFWLIATILLVSCTDQREEPITGAGSDSVETQVAVAELGAAATELAHLTEKQAERQAARQAHLAEGQAYMRINAQKPNVNVLESGLQFEILEQGDGKSPERESNVVTHYQGTFINGDVFDSSLERGKPAQFPVDRVIKGWTQALQMMKEGDVWRLVIPPHLGYGEHGAGDTIPPDTVLVFELELIEVKD